MNPFYITTPIYYVNDVPHLGHAYTTIVADALARFHRARGDATYFLTGTDEHGQKIEEAAKERGVTPIELADRVVERFRETWTHLDIQNDDFIRTTEDRHKEVVQWLWKRLEAAGDIYLDAYKGWYCVSCEAYYPEAQLEDDNTCPVHKKPARWVEEPSYFFKMSKYQDALLAHIEANPDFIRPKNYKNEVVSFVNSGLRDLSVSRTTFGWGIPVPDAPDHVMYVWIDALTNYMSALGDQDSDKYKTFWGHAIHLIGKDILRFHAVYWPTMLLAAGLPLPKSILSHGWWTVRGEKISKSMPATRVDPNELADDLGVDALRYFLLREVPLGLDGDFTYESLIGRYNSDLANDLGNLLNRTTAMASKYFGGEVPAMSESLASTGPHAEIQKVVFEVIEKAAAHLENYAPSIALEEIFRLVRETNRYVDSCQPWTLAKAVDDADKAAELAHCVAMFLAAQACAARMLAPVMPSTAASILTTLGVSDETAAAALSSWPSQDDALTTLSAGDKCERAEPLFPRIDDDRQAELLAKWIPADALAAQPSAPAPDKGGKADKGAKGAKGAKGDDGAGLVSFDDFTNMAFRVGEVVSAEPVPKTKKLLKLSVDVGDGTRQIVAGIAEAYAPADLVGKKVIVLTNLKPATIRGVESQGMILAAGDNKILGLSAVDADVPTGTVVR